MSVLITEIPRVSLLQNYVVNNNYVDCLSIVVDGDYSCKEFVRAFYTSWFFKLERLFITFTVLKPSTDKQLEQLLKGERQKFSAWSVEKNTDDQWIMCDFLSKTRSWFMVTPLKTDTGIKTQLYFGTVIVASAKDKSGKSKLTLFFKLLLIFHKWYAARLLKAAQLNLTRNSRKP
ncbi:hypothetical protein [Pleionea sediminis]|uniref:hypothetical protein n=1 Tax=Pleionea sediminis TaxID=2569479 RepID=UPI001186FD84|nr:hypothetical protein [Pleionea sediminis]